MGFFTHPIARFAWTGAQPTRWTNGCSENSSTCLVAAAATSKITEVGSQPRCHLNGPSGGQAAGSRRAPALDGRTWPTTCERNPGKCNRPVCCIPNWQSAPATPPECGARVNELLQHSASIERPLGGQDSTDRLQKVPAIRAAIQEPAPRWKSTVRSSLPGGIPTSRPVRTGPSPVGTEGASVGGQIADAPVLTQGEQTDIPCE